MERSEERFQTLNMIKWKTILNTDAQWKDDGKTTILVEENRTNKQRKVKTESLLIYKITFFREIKHYIFNEVLLKSFPLYRKKC